MIFQDDDNPKMRKRDRLLVLKVKDGKQPLSSTGNVDNRLFTGENKLHAIRSPSTAMWTLRYDLGLLPPVLKQKFTSFQKLLEFCEHYFSRRNIQIIEVID